MHFRWSFFFELSKARQCLVEDFKQREMGEQTSVMFDVCQLILHIIQKINETFVFKKLNGRGSRFWVFRVSVFWVLDFAVLVFGVPVLGP